jgi:hypothetical protein
MVAQGHSFLGILGQAWSEMDYYSRDSQEIHP